ncbi:MAG TPA: hypothetical protein VFJ97_13390 [Dermatophilaceae bacterium]|nr:hypothetical protein [Dermatophilaceae bacterium]
MPISVFLSRPSPHEDGQRRFLEAVQAHLHDRGLAPRTIGNTDYSREPMPHIRSVMMDCNGFLGLGFRRFKIIKGEDRPGAVGAYNNLGRVSNQWLTTPYLHLEAAIAFQLGLPILLFAEAGVIREGALEHGIMTMDKHAFDTTTEDGRQAFLDSEQWRQLTNSWEGEVREVVYNKGQPPKLYHR